MSLSLCVELDEELLQDVINLSVGLFAPLDGFMGAEDFHSVVERCLLSDGQVFSLPITLPVERSVYDAVKAGERLSLTYRGEEVAELTANSKFQVTDEDLEQVFATGSLSHPGVKKEKERYPFRVGGPIRLLKESLLEDALNPAHTKAVFQEKGWKTVVGFQTRNPIHCAHEHLQRVGLEVCDGLFINPITGWKKPGDFTQEAVMAGYRRMIEEFYPENRVYLAGLRTQMRYAGPREAVFHAIIRRNLGCTHFIIGRDHAGVKGFYGPYDAHALARKLQEKHDLGIQLLLLREPYYCEKCGMVVSDSSCAHYETDRVEISGTIIRACLNDGTIPDRRLMRPEIFEAIRACQQIFIPEGNEEAER